MGEANLAVNNLFKNPVYFADFINGIAFAGEQVIQPENLAYRPTKSGVLYVNSDEAKRTLEKDRDVQAWGDLNLGMHFALFCLENQNNIHYAMPVRSYLYDALGYMEQVKELEKKHIERGDLLHVDEFLSKITKDDCIYPIITFVLYWGEKPWEGSTSLYEMMGLHDNKYAGQIKGFLPDYKINPIDARQIEDVKAFKTSLQLLFSVLKYSKNGMELKRFKDDNSEQLRKVDPTIASAMITFLGERIRLGSNLRGQICREEAVDMCQGITDLIEEGREEGREEGIKIGVVFNLIDLVREKRDEGMKCQMISAFLKNNAEQVEQIYNILELNPEWTNEQIYEWMKAEK